MSHYLFFVGSPDSGKSNRFLVFNFLAYRNFMSTDVTPSNIYCFLGSQQEGQGIYAKMRLMILTKALKR
jgi:hypothetical protein